MDFKNLVLQNDKNKALKTYEERFKDKDAHDKYKKILVFAPFLGLVFSILSITLAFNFVNSATENATTIPNVNMGLALFILLALEAVKVFSVGHTTTEYLKKTIYGLDYLILLFMLATIIGSIYFSVSGANQLGNNFKNESLTLADSVNAAYNDSIASIYISKITVLKNKISTIETSDTYKKIRWAGGKATKILTSAGTERIQTLENEISTIQAEKEKALKLLQKKQNSGLEKLMQKGNSTTQVIAIISFFIEAVIVFIAFAVAKIQYDTFIQRSKESVNKTLASTLQSEDLPLNINELDTSKQTQTQSIGFTSDLQSAKKLDFEKLTKLRSYYEKGVKTNEILCAELGLNVPTLNAYRRELKKYL